MGDDSQTEVCKTQRIQTDDAQWLYIDNIYYKLYRPGYYEIGGTYTGPACQFWFYFKTEIVCDTYLLHLFILNRLDSSFRIGLSNNTHLMTEKRRTVYLSQSMKELDFYDVSECKLIYAFTYSFTPLDIEILENKKLCIGFKYYPKVGGPSLNTLDHDFGALLKEPVLSDFTIESADGHQFKVHQIILLTQSEVFCAMLKENTAEKQNNFVKLVDVNKEDLYHMLEFIYTGTIKDLHNCNYNLMLLADRYDLKDLCALLQYALCESLTIDTVLDILLVADMCNSQYLKVASLKFIKQHPQTLKMKAWKDFNNVNLVREICEYVTPPTE